MISKLGEYKDNLEDINLEMVIDAAQQGDAFSIDIIHNIGLELGKGLSIAVHLFNPQIIIIDGVLSKAQKLIVNPIEHAINKYCLADFKEDLSIEISQLGDNAKIYGVHAYVVENLLKHNISSGKLLAVIEQATTPSQQVHITSLVDYAVTLKDKTFASPTVVIIGRVVSLHEKFSWLQSTENREEYFKPSEDFQFENLIQEELKVPRSL